MRSDIDLSPSYDDVHQACINAANLIQDIDMQFNMIVGLARGGLIPGVIMSHLLNVPFTSVAYSSKAGKGDDKNHKNVLPDLDVDTNKYILFTDDIVDTGHTMSEVVQQYTNRGHNVYSFALYYKMQLNPTAYRPDFRWRTIPNDADWVHFSWEAK